MHGNFPYMFDCWADPVAHLFLLKSSMVEVTNAHGPSPKPTSCHSLTKMGSNQVQGKVATFFVHKVYGAIRRHSF